MDQSGDAHPPRSARDVLNKNVCNFVALPWHLGWKLHGFSLGLDLQPFALRFQFPGCVWGSLQRLVAELRAADRGVVQKAGDVAALEPAACGPGPKAKAMN